MTITIDTLPIQHHWLPTLSNIVTSDDSFSRDLIKQFDKKRSRLQAEMAGDNISISSDSCLSRRTKTPELAPHPEVPQITTTTVNNKDDTASINIRRRSAGDLLRRSSAYLRAKFEAYKGLKQQDHQDMAPPPEEDDDIADNDDNDEEQVEQQQQQTRSVFRSWSLSKKNKNNKSLTPHIEITDHQNNNNNNNINEKETNNNVHLSSSAIGSLSSSSFSSSTSLPPKKIAVNTTVLIPPPPSHQQYQYTPVQPPIITQYPPRPLKYSPVYPISDNGVEKKINPTTTENRQSSIVDVQSRDIQKDTITKSHHYRRSLPLFKLVHDSTSSPPPPPPSSRHRRRSSESDVQPIPSSNQNHHPSFTNWTKTAKRFTYWLGCQPSKIVSKKGKERAKGLNTENDPS
ncbi:hypothetical protein BJ944DRAFT_268416 [Cunninghamella echinulata]|nr:hypothetical protein BJ944DRAFT_268416 [Cunninghamella echinulata]